MESKKQVSIPLCFIDTNIFLNCLFEEFDEVSNQDVIKRLKKLLDDRKTILLLPENIKREIITGINEKHFKYKEDLSKKFIIQIDQQKKDKASKIFLAAFSKAKDTIEKELDTHKENIKIILNEIFDNANTIFIKLDDEILLNGMKRSALKLSPANKASDKSAYLKDSDAIAYEAIKTIALTTGGITKLIICTADPDYYTDEKISSDILTDFIGANMSIIGYKDLRTLLIDEFNENIPKQASSPTSIVESLQTDGLDIPRGSIITSPGSSYFCWYGSDGKRYIFPTPGIFFSWFSNPANTPLRCTLCQDSNIG